MRNCQTLRSVPLKSFYTGFRKKAKVFCRIPLSFFCKQEEAEYTVAELDEENVITEENGGMRAYPLFPFDPVRNVEVFYIEFDAGVQHESLPHVAGVEEYVFMVHGTLKMVIGGKEVVLQEKQSIRFGADIFHAYNKIGRASCRERV